MNKKLFLLTVPIGLILIAGITVILKFNHPSSSFKAKNNVVKATPTQASIVNATALPATSKLPVIGIVKIIPNQSSVKVQFESVNGAKDYRMYDIANPTIVKYAGMVHKEGENISIPSTEIEWNSISDAKDHTVVVQALDHLGPTPIGNLSNDNNAPLYQSNMAGKGMANMSGSNMGMTNDGYISVNGQGDPNNIPKVIAQSQPLSIKVNQSLIAIPSNPNATQTFFDTFTTDEGKTIKQVTKDIDSGTASYTMNENTNKAWNLFLYNADVYNSNIFTADGHFMDVLYNGGTPGTSEPLHVQPGTFAMSPKQTVDFSNGKILHLTMEVDAHNTIGRWVDFALSPANDPLIIFDPNTTFQSTQLNKTNKAVFIAIRNGQDGGCNATIINGNVNNEVSLWGAAGQASIGCSRKQDNNTYDGRGIDNRSKFDLFLTTTHMSLFEDGQLLQESDIPGGIPFTSASVYFEHSTYTKDEILDDFLKKYYPWETYYINYQRFGDEKHWDNMGFEVIPHTVSFQNLSSYIIKNF